MSSILHADLCLQHQKVSWTKQFTGIELSTDLQFNRIASDDLTLTVSVSVVSNYNKCTLNHISLNNTSHLHHFRQLCHWCTLLPYWGPVFPKFHLLISEIACHTIQTDAPIFLRVTGNRKEKRNVKLCKSCVSCFLFQITLWHLWVPWRCKMLQEFNTRIGGLVYHFILTSSGYNCYHDNKVPLTLAKLQF